MRLEGRRGGTTALLFTERETESSSPEPECLLIPTDALADGGPRNLTLRDFEHTSYLVRERSHTFDIELLHHHVFARKELRRSLVEDYNVELGNGVSGSDPVTGTLGDGAAASVSIVSAQSGYRARIDLRDANLVSVTTLPPCANGIGVIDLPELRSCLLRTSPDFELGKEQVIGEGVPRIVEGARRRCRWVLLVTERGARP